MARSVIPEEARQRRRPTKQGAVLSEELIVECALRLLGQHGSQGLTARRLGAVLGADPSTLYRYFHGVDDLIRAIADELIRQAMRDWNRTGDWQSDLRDLGHRIHIAYLAHPQAAVMTASRVTGRSHEIACDEAILGTLRTAGFPDPDAVRIYHCFIDQSLAFAALDAAALALPDSARQADEEVWQATYTALPEATYPHIAATADLLVARMNLSAYPSALDMLLDSAAAELASSGTVG